MYSVHPFDPPRRARGRLAGLVGRGRRHTCWAAALVLLAAAITLWAPPRVSPAAAAVPTWMDTTQTPAQRTTALMAVMTLDDKLSMLHNTTSCAYAGCTPSSFSGGSLPPLHLQDGPLGVGDGVTGVTQMPAPVAGAASWDLSLMQQYGTVLGQEHWGKGVNVVLGPTVNIVRDPRWGRAFESFGEDPYLTGQIAAANINGIQAQGPLAQIKHYAAYNQETFRNSTADNVIASERTLREIYTPGFETAIKQANVASAMCSYSVVNGQFACENNHLQNEILKGDMGFQGFITADWGATHSTVASANGGLDMEMPDSNKYYGAALKTAVTNGQVSLATIDDHVRRILTQMFRFGLFDKTQTGTKSSAVTSSAHNGVARQVAEQGSVLLKNSGPILPLTSTTHTIAVIGDDAGSGAMYQGGGSAAVNASYTVTPYNGIKARAGTAATVNYYPTSTQSAAVAGAQAADVAIVFVNKFQSEGSDTGDIELGATQNNLVSAVAAANPNTIVVLNTGSAVTMPWVNNVKGIIEAWYPGQENGNAIASLLFGDVNPSGKLPVTFPKALADVPANTTAQWPGTNGQVQYSEALNVGYRSYDARNVAPLFPFGFGLSYTTFAYSGLTVGQPDSAGNVAASFTVGNTGSRAGSEVAQVYLGAPSTAGEPPKSLRGFKKVNLAAGASTQVSLTLPLRAFQYWGASGWTTAAGTHTVSVGSSSRDIRLTGTVSTTGTTPTTETPLSRTGWVVSASSSAGGDVPANAIDGNAGTRWSTGTAMANGQYYQVDMGTARTFDQVTIDAGGSTNDYPRGVSVQVSSTGTSWTTVATSTGTTAQQTVSFPAQTTRYLRVVQTGSAPSWWSIAEFNVLTAGTTPPPPTTPTALARTGWVASANPVGDPAANAIDGNTSTRFSTGTAMANGQYFQVDMGSSKTFDQVSIDAGGSANDYARGYTIQVSNDANSWTPVASGTGSGPVVTARFANQSTRYLRVVQTGSAPSWWSIAEFNVYAG